MLLHNGKQYARVSDILRPFTDYGHIDPFVLSNKARIGTATHEAIEDDIKGNFPCPGLDCMGYFNSYEVWKKHLVPVFLRSEERYFDDELMITGQIDAVVSLGSEKQKGCLVDFKTSAIESKEVWPMQAHLYAALLCKNGIQINEKMLFIKLHKNGIMPEVFIYKWNSNTYAKCLEAVANFWKNNTK